jgi:hypothetical protein
LVKKPNEIRSKRSGSQGRSHARVDVVARTAKCRRGAGANFPGNGRGGSCGEGVVIDFVLGGACENRDPSTADGTRARGRCQSGTIVFRDLTTFLADRAREMNLLVVLPLLLLPFGCCNFALNSE